MEFKNSYIFLERKEEKHSIKQTTNKNKIEISLTPSLKELLQKSFKKISFDVKEDRFDIINSGTFQIEYNNEKIEVKFKYHNVWSNYYLDIIVNARRKQDAVNILDIVNSSLICKKNVFDKYFVSIVSYDYISEYYCNKLFPYLNEFERKLRKILFNIYTLNFNLEYYSATTTEEFQKDIKEKSNRAKEENVSKEDSYIKLAFYSLDYSDIDKLLFTKSIQNTEIVKLQEFLNENDDLTKLSDEELRKTFNLCSYKNDWERFFDNKKFDDDFHETLNHIRNFRNSIAHCKFINKNQYENCILILKKSIKSLDEAIKVTEEQDFINKNVELQHDSFARLAKTMRKSIMNIYSTIIENIDAMTQPLNDLSQRLTKILKPITSMVSELPNVVIPEIDLPEINIPNYFEEVEENQKINDNE